MLVLSRDNHESIVISMPDGRLVEVVVLEIVHRGKVRLGINAPSDVGIDRKEIWDDKHRGKTA